MQQVNHCCNADNPKLNLKLPRYESAVGDVKYSEGFNGVVTMVENDTIICILVQMNLINIEMQLIDFHTMRTWIHKTAGTI